MERTVFTTLVRSALSAAIGTVALYAIWKAQTVLGGHLYEGLLTRRRFWTAAAVFFLTGGLIGFQFARHRQFDGWRAALGGMAAAYAGVTAGVIAWAMMEEAIFSRFGTYPIYEEHNLFPIEIIILWVFAAIPVAVGILLGSLLRRCVITT